LIEPDSTSSVSAESALRPPLVGVGNSGPFTEPRNRYLRYRVARQMAAAMGLDEPSPTDCPIWIFTSGSIWVNA
jgi:hypothetical protein